MGAKIAEGRSAPGLEHHSSAGADSTASPTRILILGGGFGGVVTARHLERLCKRRRDVEIVLVSRDNFLVMTPLLFEVCSGALDARHCSFPIRAFLRATRFVEAASGTSIWNAAWFTWPPGPNRVNWPTTSLSSPSGQ